MQIHHKALDCKRTGAWRFMKLGYNGEVTNGLKGRWDLSYALKDR